MAWEKVKDILRPDMEKVFMGEMKVDESKCNKCGLCIKNCVFRAWKFGPNGFPVMKEVHECFSCFNCMVACPQDAISIVDQYHVTDGFWKTIPYPLPVKLPLDPKDEDGNPTEWNEVEKTVFTRRSVRNFKDKPVPEAIIQRIIEAGRFAPTGANCQPWKFIVITDKVLIKKIDKEVTGMMDFVYKAYTNDETVKNLIPIVEAMGPGTVDPRIIYGGMGGVLNNEDMTVTFNAPVLILMCGDERSAGSLEMHIGICGQNMILVAKSLGIGVCWNGFIGTLLDRTSLRRKLGIKKPWKFVSCLCLGYPKFKQEGIVPREYRPITWYREGKEGPEMQE